MIYWIMIHYNDPIIFKATSLSIFKFYIKLHLHIHVEMCIYIYKKYTQDPGHDSFLGVFVEFMETLKPTPKIIEVSQ